MGLERVSLKSFDFVVLENIEVVGVFIGGWRELQFFETGQTLLVEAGDGAAALDDGWVFFEARVEDGGLQIVEAGIESPTHDLAVRAASMVAELEHAVVDAIVVREDGASVAQAAEGFGGEKADGGGGSKGPCALVAEAGAEGLGGVFNNNEAVLVGDGFKRCHVGGASVELGWENGARARGDGFRDRAGVDQMVRPAFDRNRDRLREMNRRRGGDHGVRAEDHFVALADARGAQGDQESVGGVGDAERVCTGRRESGPGVPRTRPARAAG